VHICVDNNAFVVDNLVSYFFLLDIRKIWSKVFPSRLGGT